MQSFNRNLAVGLFVLLAFVALGWLVVKFGAKPRVLANTYVIRINFPSAAMVTEGCEVQANGMLVGHVADVRPVDGFVKGVVVIADIENHYTIPRKCRAIIRAGGLTLGKPAVQIEVPRDARQDDCLKKGDEIQGEILSGVENLIPEDLMNRMKDLTNSLGRITEDLHQLMEPRPLSLVDEGPPGVKGPASRPDRLLPNLSTAVQRMDATLKRLNEMLTPGTGDLAITLANIRDASGGVKDIAETLKTFSAKAVVVADSANGAVKSIDTAFKVATTQFDRVGTDAHDMAVQFSSALDKLNKSLDTIAQGKGSIGKMLHDPALYDGMVIAVDRLQLAIIELQHLISKWEAEGVGIKLK